MEKNRKQTLLKKLGNTEIEHELNWLYLHTQGCAESICIINDRTSFSLKKIEFLILLRSPLPGYTRGPFTADAGLSEKELQEARKLVSKVVQWFEEKTNYQASVLAVSLEEFDSLLNSPRPNYLKHMARKEIAVLGAQEYWLQFTRMRYQGRLSLPFDDTECDPLKLSHEDIHQAFAEYGYIQTRKTAKRTRSTPIESALAAALIQKEPRLLEAIPVILAKDNQNEINYPLIEFLAEKHGNLKLFGFLLETAIRYAQALKPHAAANSLLKRIKQQSKNVDTSLPVDMHIRSEDIRETMRSYHVA